MCKECKFILSTISFTGSPKVWLDGKYLAKLYVCKNLYCKNFGVILGIENEALKDKELQDLLA